MRAIVNSYQRLKQRIELIRQMIPKIGDAGSVDKCDSIPIGDLCDDDIAREYDKFTLVRSR